MDATVVLQYIINTSNIGNDSYLMEMNDFQEYIFVNGVFGHYLYKSRNLVYLFFIESNNLLFTSLYGFLEKNGLKKEHNESYEYKAYKNKKNKQIHISKRKVGILLIQEYTEKERFWKFFYLIPMRFFFFFRYFTYTLVHIYIEHPFL